MLLSASLMLRTFLDNLHLLFEILLEGLIEFACGNTVDQRFFFIWYFLWNSCFSDLGNSFLILYFLEFIKHKSFKFFDFMKVRDQDLYEFELKLLLDELVGNVRTVNQFYE